MLAVFVFHVRQNDNIFEKLYFDLYPTVLKNPVRFMKRRSVTVGMKSWIRHKYNVPVSVFHWSEYTLATRPSNAPTAAKCSGTCTS